MDKQRVRILKLLEILQKNSDEEHMLSTADLIDSLKQENIEIERKTLYEDIKLLNAFGYEVLCEKRKSNYYYVADRYFELPELKILLDAVQSANFITEKKSKTLTDKISAFAGTHKADLMTRNAVWVNTTKHRNENIYYNIDALVDGILSKRQVSFRYFDFDLKKNRVFRKEGKRYQVTPVYLVYTNDNYYLIGYSEKYDDFAHYRIDRMDDVAAEEIQAAQNSKITEFDFYAYKKKVFGMFPGKEEKIELIVHNNLIDTVLDKFGEQTKLMYYDETHFLVNVNVEISQTYKANFRHVSRREKS